MDWFLYDGDLRHERVKGQQPNLDLIKDFYDKFFLSLYLEIPLKQR